MSEAPSAADARPRSGLRVQLWSYNYAPEPTGIGPVSAAWARALAERGHEVEVVAAHPHYPAPLWGRRLRPYRETRDGVPVLRLPLWVGRRTLGQRLLQESTFTAVEALASPLLRTPDVLVAVSPSFPALAPAMVNARLRKLPWVLWLQDILPDGAAQTGLLEPGALLDLARRLEAAAYGAAARIIVISETFRENLMAKGVPPQKVERIYNPSTRSAPERVVPDHASDGFRILSMGNIGRSQGLAELVRAFVRSDELGGTGARLAIAGDGVAAEGVRAAADGERAEMLGLLPDEALERELRRATLGLVSQRADIAEFNVPSKLMNFLAYGIPVVASVSPSSEVATIVRSSGGGWVVDNSDPDGFPRKVAEVLRSPQARDQASRAAFAYAREHLAPERAAATSERILLSVLAARGDGPPGARPKPPS